MEGGGGDAFGSSTAPLTWHDFLERMRHPSAADFVKSIKRSVSIASVPFLALSVGRIASSLFFVDLTEIGLLDLADSFARCGFPRLQPSD
ncbi:hypothetical protein B296_00010169 [Ensete ventricosum]|uniref:Uncharacterized protein n=1 Tax=Ensete ventricosum TaxID=4639 RepID=A0A427BA69_ENSVE|nr:hypothetical protein B296_00010169 [Ensete ventricosum]